MTRSIIDLSQSYELPDGQPALARPICSMEGTRRQERHQPLIWRWIRMLEPTPRRTEIALPDTRPTQGVTAASLVRFWGPIRSASNLHGRNPMHDAYVAGGTTPIPPALIKSFSGAGLANRME